MIRIAGLDVSRNWAVICVLSSFPDISPLQFFEKNRPHFKLRKDDNNQKYNEYFSLLSCNRGGVDLLTSLEVDEIILEPTGYWYSGFWVNVARQLGIKVNWISHQEVKRHRDHYGFKNKDDDSDAFAMALMYFDPGARDRLGQPRFIKDFRHDDIDSVRRSFLEREQLNKTENLTTNQLRQRLCIEYPEIAQRDFKYIGKKGINPTLGHIAGLIKNPRIKGETVGIGITGYSQYQARDIIRIETRIINLENDLEGLTALFPEYDNVFRDFGFGVILRSLLLIHCYPIERFFVDGKPYRLNGHDLSLRKFQAYLGLAYVYERSGDTSKRDKKVKKKWHGSDLVRAHLYAWCLVNVCPDKAIAINDIQRKLKSSWLYDRVDPLTLAKSPAFKTLGKDGICRLLFYLTRLLYQELRKSVT